MMKKKSKEKDRSQREKEEQKEESREEATKEEHEEESKRKRNKKHLKRNPGYPTPGEYLWRVWGAENWAEGFNWPTPDIWDEIGMLNLN